jgi:hypothetical protein
MLVHALEQKTTIAIAKSRRFAEGTARTIIRIGPNTAGEAALRT